MTDRTITVGDQLEKLDKQASRIYNYIIEQTAANGVTPTLRDIMSGLGFSSSSVVFYHFEKLVEAGLIIREHDFSKRYAVVGMKIELDRDTPIEEVEIV